MTIKIENDVPIPIPKRKPKKLGPIQFALSKLEIGQSFEARGLTQNQANNHCYRANIRTGHNFTYRTIDFETIRFWRVQNVNEKKT